MKDLDLSLGYGTRNVERRADEGRAALRCPARSETTVHGLKSEHPRRGARRLPLAFVLAIALAGSSALADTTIAALPVTALWTDSSAWGLMQPCYPNRGNCVHPGEIEFRWHAILPTGANLGLDIDLDLIELILQRGSGIAIAGPAASTITVDENIAWIGGLVSGPGTIRSLSNLTMGGSTGIGVANHLIIDNEANASLTGLLSLNTGNTITNNAIGIFELLGDGSIETINFPQSVFNNDGLVQKTAGGMFELSLPLNNSAIGQVHVESGALRVTSAGTGSGLFTVDAGATLEFAAPQPYVLDPSATVGGQGTILLGGRLDSSANWNVDGTTQIAGGVTNFLVPATTRSVIQSGGRITGDLVIQDALTWNDGVQGPGNTLAQGDVDISGMGPSGHILDNRVLNLSPGHTTNVTAQLIGNAAIINNPPGATFNMGASLLAFSPVPVFNNSGNFIKLSADNSNLDWAFINSGLFDLTAGTVGITNSFTQIAGQTRLSGGSLVASVPIQIEAGQLTGSGAITALVTNNGTIAPGSPIGTLVFNLPLSLGADSALAFDIGGRTQGVDYDFLSSAGQLLALNGRIQAQFLNGFETSVTDTDAFVVIEACPQCLSGSFANAQSGGDLPTADGLGTFTVFYGPSSPFPPGQVVLTSFRAAL
jgi:hypothetical protein